MNTKTQAVDFAGISKNMRADSPGNSPDVRNYWQLKFIELFIFSAFVLSPGALE